MLDYPNECEPFTHKFIETYYGYKCTVCGLFVAFGSEYWVEIDDCCITSNDEYIPDEEYKE